MKKYIIGSSLLCIFLLNLMLCGGSSVPNERYTTREEATPTPVATPPWIQYTEKAVGENHPTLSDTVNRPLKWVWEKYYQTWDIALQGTPTPQPTPTPVADKLLLPLGSILPYAAATAPDGWLLCQGQAISRTTYATLYALIGTTYGTGDGSTTFNLPDVQGRVIVGSGSGSGLTTRTVADKLGEETHTLTVAEIPAAIPRTGSCYINGVVAGTHTSAGTTNNTGSSGGGAHNVMQPSLVMLYIIRVL
jgi:microcystin-dependent protein